jgi:hypothetical protein
MERTAYSTEYNTIQRLIAINCSISDTVLDYMHMVCISCLPSLMLWVRGPLPFRLPATVTGKLNNSLNALSSFTTSEFSRKPRNVSETDQWKATEFCQFLLFTGPLVLHGVLPEQLHVQFLVTKCSIIKRVVSLCHHILAEFAKKLLTQFVS